MIKWTIGLLIIAGTFLFLIRKKKAKHIGVEKK